MYRRSSFFTGVFLFILAAAVSFSQEEGRNLNTYYRFPLSIGVEYQSYTPFGAYGSQYNIFELGGNVRWPIPGFPLLQPTLKGGMISFDSQDETDPEKWDNTHWFVGANVLFSHRFAKNFEIGAELGGAFTQANFPNLSPDRGPVGTKNIIAEAGVRLGLNPSFNFNVEVHPNIKYFHSFSPLTDYNGFIFGIGFSGNFRFGKDPDSPQSIIRSIRFDSIQVPSVFSAMQSYYVKNPVGTVVITNTEKQPIKDVTVSFYQNGYMDSPTVAKKLPEIPGQSQKTIDLLASFNSEIFTTEGITPLTGEVIVSYTSGGRPVEQKQSVTYDLHDKTALTWDDDRKVAAFVTPADSALRNYTSFLRQALKDETLSSFNKNLQIAMQIYNGLQVIGLLYQVDPLSPFTTAQDNPVIVDSISLSRDTLKRITGDCDDLTVLYCSLLETVGIQSGFITVPGHIYAVFNTGQESRKYKEIHPDRNMIIDVNGSIWVPVEVTMVGTGGFLEAWRKGIEEYRMFENEPTKRGFYLTREAQKEYRPVGLKEIDLGLQYGTEDQITKTFIRDLGKLIDTILAPYVKEAEEDGSPRAYNQLGIMQARFQQQESAEKSFAKALSLNRNYFSAKVNLANMRYLRGEYNAAAEEFLGVFENLEKTGKGETLTGMKILLNASKSFYAMEKFNEAQKYYKKAEEIDKGKVQEFSYLASVAASSDGTARASNAGNEEKALFFFEEEESAGE